MGWRVDMHWLLYSFVTLCISVAWDAVRVLALAWHRDLLTQLLGLI